MTKPNGFGQTDIRSVTRSIALLCAALLTGCANGRTYQAEKLPVQLEAPVQQNSKTIDLTHLVTSSQSSERISTGDVLDISIAARLSIEETIKVAARVDERGVAAIPDLGDVPVAGLELAEAEAVIAETCRERGQFKMPHVTVTMKQRKVNYITVMGAVKKPGVYPLPHEHCDLLSALMAAQGLADDAGTFAEVRQPALNSGALALASAEGGALGGHSLAALKPTVESMRIDLAEVSATNGGRWLADRSVVMVEKRDPQPIQVLGLVRKQGQIEFPIGKNIHLLDAIAMSGGMASGVANKILVIRQLPGQPEPAVIEVKYNTAKRSSRSNLRLAPGDVVSVEYTPATVAWDAIKNFVNIGVGATARVPGL